MSDQPFVSVITPVYNGEKYLAECMDSVLGQTYSKFEYVILDNASTDSTADTAARVAAADPRVRIVRNDATLPVIRNWNKALGLVSPDSVYCKVVHADDMILPDYLKRMVGLAERHPSVGVFSSRGMRGDHVLCQGLAPDREVFSGRDIVRLFLRQEIFAIAPSCMMIRADVLRRRQPFYPEAYLHSDHAAYIDILDSTDLGFVPEVLSFSRTHADSITATVAQRRKTVVRDRLFMLREFGPRYFTDSELAELESRHLERYYRILVRSLVTRPSRSFLSYHLSGLREAGCLPGPGDLALAVAADVRASIAHPDKVYAYLRGRFAPRY